MFNLDPDKNPIIYLFIGSLVFMLVFTCWPYLICAIIVVALVVKAFTGLPHHNHGNHRRSRRRCRR